MSGSVFQIRNDGRLVEMFEQPYDCEARLQELLADYPDILGGQRTDSTSPRRWILLKREMRVPSTLDGQGRWALDHLLLDQDGVPTLVEVKRNSNTQIRREVVGQMLDYAANAVVYWPIDDLRRQFEATCRNKGVDAAQEVSRLLELDKDVEQFWLRVKNNLQAARIRMIFVADSIPTELRRIVEFLNQQMDPAEVLAVEVKQFGGDGTKTLVSTVFGQTAGAEKRKGTGGDGTLKRWWTPFLDYARTQTALHSEKIARENPWVRTASPLAGASFVYNIAKTTGTVELNIDSPSKEKNKEIFDELFAAKEEIEKRFQGDSQGGTLVWKRLDDKIRSAIEFTVDGGYSDEGKWESTCKLMVNAMIRLEQTLRPYLLKINAERD
jgi:hypothetical protein